MPSHPNARERGRIETEVSSQVAGAPAASADMAWIPPGELVMGCAGFYPEERPVRPVAVDRGPVDLSDPRTWSSYVPGASWSRPEGPGSDTYEMRPAFAASRGG
jgi:hypothetical protein